MSWRLARSLETLRDEVNAIAPGRSRKSDGTIGDTAHQRGASDHNPTPAGVVCALDLTHDPAGGADMRRIAEHIRTRRHPCLRYVIFDRRIASASSGWAWRPYTGSNPHTKHCHVSVGNGPDGKSTGGYDDTSPWGLATSTGGIKMFCRLGDSGEHVQALQAALNAIGGFGPRLTEDGKYGPATAAAVLAMRRSVGSKQTSGDVYDAHAHVQLQIALVKHFGVSKPAPAAPPAEVDYVKLVDELLGRLAATQGQARE